MRKKNIIVGISGGIAGYKSADLIRNLKIRRRYEISVILTQSASRMFGSKIFEEASGGKVYHGEFTDMGNIGKVLKKRKVEHVSLADSADLIIVVPATANLIAKIRGGFADDLLTAVILASKAPVIVCPSMNANMWANPILQENLRNLSAQNFFILPPVSGILACGYKGIGRLPPMKDIFSTIERFLIYMESLKGIRIIVTAGATREYFDGVRFITNKGSGKMGAAIAVECKRRGAEVLLLKAQSAVLPDLGVDVKDFDTVADLYNLVKNNVAHYDAIFHTASVSDFTLEKKTEGKLQSGKNLKVQLLPAVKILHHIKSWNPAVKVMGFKAVYDKKYEEMVKIAQKKLEASRADYIIANDVGRKDIGFGADQNEVVVVSGTGKAEKIPKDTKANIASKIIDLVLSPSL